MIRKLIQWFLDDDYQSTASRDLIRAAESLSRSIDRLSEGDRGKLLVEYPEFWVSVIHMDTVLTLIKEGKYGTEAL